MPLVLLARKTLPANSLSELVSEIRKGGTPIKCGLGGGVGSIAHLVLTDFARSAGVKIEFIPYRGGAPALTDLIAGHVDISLLTPDAAAQQISSGTVKGLAVASSARLPSIPDVANAVESGHPNLSARFWQGLFAPSGTPATIIHRLNAALQLALADPNVRKRFEEAGSYVFPKEEQTPEAANTMLSSEIKRWGEVIRANKIELPS
jgi:tripartite-type tricarboxylate transporter receptor subunit TctC